MKTDELIAVLANGAEAVELGAPQRRYAVATGWGAFGATLLMAMVLGVRPDLAEDPRFATNPGRVRNREALVPVLREIIAAKPRDHWLMHMQGAIDAMPTSDSVRTRLSEYMSNAAQHLVNTGQ